MAGLALSVVIVSWRTRELTLTCLRALEAERAAGAPDFEVVLVDNASGDGTAEAVRREFPAVELIESARNVGFAAACNLAFPRGKGRVVLFLNPDTEVSRGTLARIVEFFEREPRATIAGAALVTPDGAPQFSCGRFLTPVNQVAETLGLARLLPLSALRRTYDARELVGEAVEVDWVAGACMAVRREALERAGGFDERFFMYSEDEDLCRRIGGVYFLPGVRVDHHGGRSAEQDPRRMRAAFRRSQALFLRKHNGRAAELVFRALAAVARMKPPRAQTIPRPTGTREDKPQGHKEDEDYRDY